LNIKEYKPDELIAAEYNPRQLTKDQHKDLTDSIKRFGLVDPLIVNTHKDRMNVLVGGHQRLKIAQELDIKDIPCVEVELNPDQERELNIRLNKNSGEWDYDALANYFDVGELTEWGFTDDELQFYEDEDFYTQKITPIVYEPKSDKPDVSELYDMTHTKDLIERIKNNQEIDENEKEFLIISAYRHIVFDYAKIAEFYANSDNDVKGLIEDSALILVDSKKAIEQGFLQLTEDLTKTMVNDYA